jgi:hypothetical protein
MKPVCVLVLLMAFNIFLAYIIRIIGSTGFVDFTGQVLIRLVLSFFIIYFLVKLSDIKKAIRFFLIIQGFVAVIIILQLLTANSSFTFFWDIKQVWIGNTPNDFSVHELINAQLRPPGLYSYAIPASYAMVWSLILAFLLRHNKVTKIAILLFGLGALATLTRSVIPVVLLVWICTFYRYKSFWLIISFLSWYLFTLIDLSQIKLALRILSFDDASAVTRPHLWLVGWFAGIQSIIGVVDWHDAMRQTYNYTGDYFVFTNAPHNGLLSAIYTGGFTYLLLCSLLLLTLYKKDLPAAKTTICIIGYIIHSFFHNNFVGISDWHGLFVIAFMNNKYVSNNYSNRFC